MFNCFASFLGFIFLFFVSWMAVRKKQGRERKWSASTEARDPLLGILVGYLGICSGISLLLCWAGYQKLSSTQNIFPSIVTEQTLRAALDSQHRSPLLEAGGDKFKPEE